MMAIYDSSTTHIRRDVQGIQRSVVSSSQILSTELKETSADVKEIKKLLRAVGNSMTSLESSHNSLARGVRRHMGGLQRTATGAKIDLQTALEGFGRLLLLIISVSQRPD